MESWTSAGTGKITIPARLWNARNNVIRINLVPWHAFIRPLKKSREWRSLFLTRRTSAPIASFVTRLCDAPFAFLTIFFPMREISRDIVHRSRARTNISLEDNRSIISRYGSERSDAMRSHAIRSTSNRAITDHLIPRCSNLWFADCEMASVTRRERLESY